MHKKLDVPGDMGLFTICRQRMKKGKLFYLDHRGRFPVAVAEVFAFFFIA